MEPPVLGSWSVVLAYLFNRAISEGFWFNSDICEWACVGAASFWKDPSDTS